MKRFIAIILMSFMLVSFNSGVSLTTNTKTITLTADNTLILNGIINSKSVGKLQEDVTKIDALLPSGYPMYLFLYTPGGYIEPGLQLLDFFSGLNRPVHTVSLFAASMGFQFIQHLGKRYVLRYSTLMSHKARGGFSGEFGGGVSQLDSRYGLWLRRVDMMDKQTVKRTKGKQTLTSYRAAYQPELWLNGHEAVAQGYADEVVVVKCDSTLSGIDKRIFKAGYYSIEVWFSQCPIKTAPIKVMANLFTNQGEMELEEFLKKDGKFGVNCNNDITLKPEIVPSPWESNDVTNTTPIKQDKKLCAKDVTLTLEKLQKAMSKKREFYTRDLKNHIKYSY